MEHNHLPAPEAGHAPRPGVRATGAVEALILDWGNVMHRWDADGAVAGRVEPGLWEELTSTGEFARWNQMWDAGASLEEVLDAVAAEQPGRSDKAAAMRTYWEHFDQSLTGPVEGTATLVDALLEAGTPLYCLTNFNHLLWPHGLSRVPQLARFEGIVVSGQECLAKPDPRIYRLLLERYGLDGARTLFVDDSAANIAGAQAVGLVTHHFTTAAGLREDLAARGLLPVALD